MKLHKNLYTGELTKKEIRSILNIIKNKKRTYIKKAYCIILPIFDDGIMEVYEYNQLLLPHIDSKKIVIIGIARNYNEALEYVAIITDMVYQKIGTVNIHKYFD